jgi:SNF2 family DNA or RNA helicase
VIPQRNIDEFVNGRRDDHRWIKRCTHEELLAALANLEPPMHPFEGTRKHQLACLLLGAAYPRFSFWLDMGAGKTLVALELIRYWSQTRAQRALVFITSDKALPTWVNQIDRFGIKVPYCDATSGSSKEKWAQIGAFDKGIIFVTYPGAVAMVSDRVKTRKRKYAMEINKSKVARLVRDLDIAIFDESTRAGNHTSLTHQLCRMVSKAASSAHNLAGRPLGRDPTLIWGQQHLVDFGESLGPTLGLFRAAFFSEEPNPWGGEYSKNYIFKRSKKKELARMIRHRSISYSSNECVELPDVVPIIEKVNLPLEVRTYYRDIADKMRQSRGDFRALKNGFVRLRQLSSGFLGFKNDDTGERAEIEFGQNPKLERLIELIESKPKNRKALVFYDFTWSGRKIMGELQHLGIEAVWLWSGTKDAKLEIQRFIHDPKCEVAVLNNRVGAYSLDGMQVANYVFFYESPVPVIDRDQAQRRAVRDGQRFRVFQYDLVARGTADERILLFHKEGDDIFKALMRDPALLADSALQLV